MEGKITVDLCLRLWYNISMLRRDYIMSNKFIAELREQHSKFTTKQNKQRNARRTELSPLRNEDFYYTDASKYAEQYYGDTYRATTGLDDDWGDY